MLTRVCVNSHQAVEVAFETKDFYCSKRTNIKVQLCYSTTGSVPLPATNSGNTESIAEYLDIWTGPESRVERGTQNTVLVVHGCGKPVCLS
jgi:hypothetical protein